MKFSKNLKYMFYHISIQTGRSITSEYFYVTHSVLSETQTNAKSSFRAGKFFQKTEVFNTDIKQKLLFTELR